MSDEQEMAGSHTLRATALSGRREAAVTATPAARAALIVAALLIAVALAYEARATSNDGIDHSWFAATALLSLEFAPHRREYSRATQTISEGALWD
ncbi:hypothetical protein [Nocardia sp. Marseille-Q1738]